MRPSTKTPGAPYGPGGTLSRPAEGRQLEIAALAEASRKDFLESRDLPFRASLEVGSS